MKWLVELEDGERLEVEYISLPPGTLTVPLTENETALKRHDSISVSYTHLRAHET